LNGHIENVTRRVAEAGMVGLGIDIFHRAGGGTAPYTDFKQAMALFEGLTDEGLTDDLGAAIAHLGSTGFAASSVGVVGFCFGGRVAFLAAVRFALGAAVSYYGGGIVSQGAFKAFPPLLDSVPALQTPFLGLFGDQDRSIPVDDVERLRAAVPSAPVATDIVRYPEADHGFHCDERPSYDADASADAWARSMAFIREHAG
jgi:carboxymethylenebutenolidase